VVLMPVGRVVLARRASACPYCGTGIGVGDRIGLVAYGRFGCSACAGDEQLRRRLVSRDPKADNPAYTRACPTCGAAVMASCVTGSGKKRPVHPARGAGG
jgi:hypothetical protein